MKMTAQCDSSLTPAETYKSWQLIDYTGVFVSEDLPDMKVICFGHGIMLGVFPETGETKFVYDDGSWEDYIFVCDPNPVVVTFTN